MLPAISLFNIRCGLDSVVDEDHDDDDDGVVNIIK